MVVELDVLLPALVDECHELLHEEVLHDEELEGVALLDHLLGVDVLHVLEPVVFLREDAVVAVKARVRLDVLHFVFEAAQGLLLDIEFLLPFLDFVLGGLQLLLQAFSLLF